MKAFAALVASATVTVALSSCSLEPGGPQYAEIELSAAPEDLPTRPPPRECVPLPVLPGGRLENDFDLLPELSAHVVTEDSFAEVTLRTTDPAEGTIRVPKASLLAGFTQRVPVTTASGNRYTVTLTSSCASPGDGGT